MYFSLSQIIAILVPLAVALPIIFFWYKRDAKVSAKNHQEKLATLISVFFWGAFGCLMLKLLIDLIYHFDSRQVVLASGWFYVFSIFLEEIIKAGALIAGLEIAEKRFDEVSDGIVYGAMSALGFLFFENIFYLLNTKTTGEFFTVLSLRYLSTFGIHLLSTTVFGLTYARAYLGYKKRLNVALPKPYDIFHHFKYLITQGNYFLNLLKLVFCVDLFRAVYLILTKQTNRLLPKALRLAFPSIFIIEGFLLGFYLHLLCNAILGKVFFGWLLLTIMPLFSFVVYLGFYRLNQE